MLNTCGYIVTERRLPDALWPYVVELWADIDIWDFMLEVEMYVSEN